jgi:Spy/CpxP family protein refolding chaperone
MHDGKREMIFRAIARHLVHPGILAFHQKDLNLTQEQKDYLKMQIQETRSVLSGMEWELAEAVGGLVSILEQDTIDEQEAQNQLDTILDMENAIKKERLGLMIRIKNSLTEEQLKIIEDNRSDWIQEIVDHKHSREKQSPGQH